MTSDAKIGLLLGLVFIFIIAFVINGLPRFRSTTSNSELTNNIVNPGDDSLGIGERERRVQETFNQHGRFASETARNLQPIAGESGNAGYDASLPDDTVVAFNNNQDSVRYTMPLTPNASVMEENPAVGSASQNEPVAPVENIVQTSARAPKPAGPAQPKTYTVQDGDRLSDIAKKFYGQVEGNKLANINRIYQANKKLLKSVDDIFVGQKLVIPPISGSASSAGEGSSIFSSGLFERVKSIGRSSEKTRVYVVKDGDSLWTIAAEQLGQGVRYKEISKLNSDILPDEDSVRAGMRLRLPAQ